MHAHTVQFTTLQYRAVHCSTVQCTARLDSVMECWIVQDGAVQCSAVQCTKEHSNLCKTGGAVKYNAVQCSAVECSTVQCITVQCSTVQCSVVQYSEVLCRSEK